MKKLLSILLFILGSVAITAAEDVKKPVAAAAVQTLDNLIIAPNPHLAGNADVQVRFEINPAFFVQATVNIYNIAGEWVKELRKEDLVIENHPTAQDIKVCKGVWDTKNLKGELVKSGVYLLNITTADTKKGKQVKTVKLVVIR